jgi:hypothetical protein
MLKMRKGTDSSKTLPIYNSYLLFTCATFFAVVVLQFIPVSDDSLAFTVINDLVTALEWIVQISCCLFMFHARTDERTGRTVFFISVVISLVWLAIRLVPHFVWTSCPACGELIVQSMSVLFFSACFLAAYLPVKWKPRPAIKIWAAFQTLAHVSFGIVNLFDLLGNDGEGERCTDLVSIVFYYLAYVPLLYYVLKVDTAYWRQHGALLRHADALDEHDELDDDLRIDAPTSFIKRSLNGSGLEQLKDSMHQQSVSPRARFVCFVCVSV